MLMNTFPSEELVFMQKPGGNGIVLVASVRVSLLPLRCPCFEPQSSAFWACSPTPPWDL